MLIQNSVQRSDLTLKLSRMSDELKSKGTVTDPVSRQVPWCEDSVACFESRLEEFPQPTLAEMRAACNSRSQRRNLMAAGFGTAGFLTGLVAIANATSAGPAFPIALTASTGLAIAAFANLHAARLDDETAKGLTRWENAFQASAQRGEARANVPHTLQA